MPRLFVVFRTYDRIWTCQTYTRELATFELDMSSGPVKLMFLVDQIVRDHEGEQLYLLSSKSSRHQSLSNSTTISFYCRPHQNFHPQVVRLCSKHPPVLPSPQNGSQRGLMRRFSLPSLETDIQKSCPGSTQADLNNIFYFVLPMYRCTVLADAYVISLLSKEYSRSRVFRKRLISYIKRNGGFRDCVPDYAEWTDEEREAWENYLPIPYMIDFVAVWPHEKRDFAWEPKVLNLLRQNISLEEGFAWLSTLGGAHSSLGETFVYHAERAGKISCQQLRVAIQLGNEHLIARCYIFYAWSLMQQGRLKKCKQCILNTWKFCHTLKGRDRVLENMCMAAWNRRNYRKSLLRRARLHTSKGCAHRKDDERRDGGSDGRGGGGRGPVVPVTTATVFGQKLCSDDKQKSGMKSQDVMTNGSGSMNSHCDRMLPTGSRVKGGNVVAVC